MKFSSEKPPNYEVILKTFKVKDTSVVFTYGDTIYGVPEGYNIPQHLYRHEFVHSKQQGDNPAEWWFKYCTDSKFRLEQELEAYSVQYHFVKVNFKRKESDQFLDIISRDLASEIYGNIITPIDAKFRIKRLEYKML